MNNVKLFSFFFGLIILCQIVIIYQLMLVVDVSSMSLAISERNFFRMLTLSERQNKLNSYVHSGTNDLKNMLAQHISNDESMSLSLTALSKAVSNEKNNVCGE